MLIGLTIIHFNPDATKRLYAFMHNKKRTKKGRNKKKDENDDSLYKTQTEYHTFDRAEIEANTTRTETPQQSSSSTTYEEISKDHVEATEEETISLTITPFKENTLGDKNLLKTKFYVTPEEMLQSFLL